MEEKLLYYNGSSARAIDVRVLLLDNELQVQPDDETYPIHSFSYLGMSCNTVGARLYVYLDQKGLQYLEVPMDHSLANELANKVALHNKSWGQSLLKQKTLVLLLLMLTLGAGLYVGVIHFIPFLGGKMITVKHEIQLGTRLKEIMLNEVNLLGSYIDTEGTHKLQAFADKLELSEQYPIQVTLVKSDMVNAYALPGGQIVIYSGLLNKIKTPEALAALLAHEGSHINERHSLKGLLRNAANGILISVLFSDASGISGAIVSNANNLNGLHYSRSLEAEADRKGCDLLRANGLDVRGMQQLMQVLEEIGDMPHSLAFLSTHPLTKERIKATQEYMEQYPQNTVPKPELKVLFDSLQQISK